MKPSLAITGVSMESMASQVLVWAGAGLLGPPLLWLAAQSAGLVPVAGDSHTARSGHGPYRDLPSGCHGGQRRTGSAPPLPSCDRVIRGHRGSELGRRCRCRRFVVCGVAGKHRLGGKSMARALARARDSGLSPWSALGRLGEEIGVSELIELSTTLELAGTEGARIRQSLSARAVSLRRHEQADAESSANAMTERLFLPGALLLVGFLLFIGYPAFTRIIAGF